MREWKRILLCAGLAMGFGCDTDDDSAADRGLEGSSGPGAGMEIPGDGLKFCMKIEKGRELEFILFALPNQQFLRPLCYRQRKINLLF